MKIAITGKGGVGKTTICSLLLRQFASDGYKVTGVDADPDSNLAQFFGIPEDKILPLSEMKELIAERTGAKPGEISPYFRLNPRVDDLPEKYGIKHQGVRLLVMGGMKRGGSGCYCPENALLRNLVQHLLTQKDEVVILDMEAGVEHLSRGTARFVGLLIIVVEPGRLSINTAFRIRKLAAEVGIEKLAVIANKISGEKDREFVSRQLTDFKIIGYLPFDNQLKGLNLTRGSSELSDLLIAGEIKSIKNKIETVG